MIIFNLISWHYEKFTHISQRVSSRWIQFNHLVHYMNHLEFYFEHETNFQVFLKFVANNSKQIFDWIIIFQNQIRYAINHITFFISIEFTYTFFFLVSKFFDFEIFAQILIEIIINKFVFVIHVFTSTLIIVFFIFWFEKFLNIFECNENKNRLNAWEQNFIQRISVNHDRYFIDRVKIEYVEFRIITKKKFTILWVNIELIIYVFSSIFSIDVKIFVIIVTISLKSKMHEHIFATNSCNVSWTLSNIIISFVKRKNVLEWKTFL